MQIQYVMNMYRYVNSHARYNIQLCRELQHIPNLDINEMVVGEFLLPPPVNNLVRKAGIDVNAFFKTYPIRWSPGKDGLIHLTNRTLSTLLTFKPRQPVLITVHDIIHYQFRHQPEYTTYQHGAQAWMDSYAVQALRKADAVVASSDYTRQALIDELGIPAERIQRVYLGIELERFQPVTVPESFYKRYKLDPDVRYVMHISTEEPRKDMPTLVRAFAEVFRSCPNVKLLKIGRPFYSAIRVQLLDLIHELGLEDGIVFIDDVTDDDLVYFYNAARLSILPSIAEGFGFPVLESMACGTPVVCSDGGSLAEIAGDAALTAVPGDVDGFANAMIRLLDDTMLWEKHRQLGLQHAATFTWAKTAHETAALYQKLLS